MDNNLTDINWILKCVSQTDITDENNKVVKVIQTAPTTHTLSALTQTASAGFMLCPGKTLTIGGLSKFLLQIVFTLSASSSSAFTLRAYAINDLYEEEVIDLVFNVGDLTKTTTNQYRCINNMEVISGAISSPTATVNAIPLGLSTNYELCRIISNATEKYNPFFMIPKGKRGKLSSIDYFRCANSTPANIASDFGCMIFFRDSVANISNTLFNYLQVSSPFSRTFNTNGIFNLEYGDLIIFYRPATTGAVSTSVSATFTLYEDAIYTN